MTSTPDSPLVDWFVRRVELGPERVALCDPWGPSSPPPRPAVTYRELLTAARRTARFLAGACGVGRGDRVAVLARNRRAYLEVLLGCGLLGAVLQALSWRLSPRELDALLVDGRPLVLLYGPECAELLPPLRTSRAAPRRFVCLDEDGEPPAVPADLRLSARAEDRSDELAEVRRGLGDPWILCYTGGSTGTPKGALLTHGSVLWNAINTSASWGLGADDCAVLNAPLFHTGGLNVFTTPLLYAGGASVLCRDFRVEQVLDLLSLPPPAGPGGRTAVSLLFGVPTMFQDLQAHPRFAAARWDRLKLVISGGAPCPAPVFERFFQAGVRFRTGYGLTEAGPNNFFLPDALVQNKPGSVGYPLLHVAAEVVAPDGTQVPAGEVGELRLRGPHLCKGYDGRPDETAAAFRDGWLYTGDLARRDADGCFYIAGRRKDMFISGGENVYPAEIESVLCAHPGVKEAAVLGVADARWGEVGLAVVVPRGPLSEAELLAHCHGRMARYKAPRRFVLVDELPRTGAGKVDKAALKARHGTAQGPLCKGSGAV